MLDENLLATGLENLQAFKKGEVALIGAGPGDPDLLTMRAYKLIKQADCIVYDRLVNREILDIAPKTAEHIYVGKQSDRHTLKQSEINQLLVKLARQNKRVVRLKGGDPFIFGRGAEEIEKLLAENISCRVVPGITAASGCSTYAGISLTHRDYVHGCTFITGHQQGDGFDLPWASLVNIKHTLVIYMGVKTAEAISQNLIEHGMAKQMPVAIIINGTTTDQKTYKTTIAALPGFIRKNTIRPPALIIIGQVINALPNKLKEHDNIKPFLRSIDANALTG